MKQVTVYFVVIDECGKWSYIYVNYNFDDNLQIDKHLLQHLCDSSSSIFELFKVRVIGVSKIIDNNGNPLTILNKE